MTTTLPTTKHLTRAMQYFADCDAQYAERLRKQADDLNATTNKIGAAIAETPPCRFSRVPTAKELMAAHMVKTAATLRKGQT